MREHNLLSETSEEKMQIALVTLKEAIDNLMKGDIIVDKLNLLINQKHTLLDLCKIILEVDDSILGMPLQADKKVEMNSEIISKVLEWRQQELDQFSHTRSLVTNFIVMCKEISPGMCTRFTTNA